MTPTDSSYRHTSEVKWRPSPNSTTINLSPVDEVASVAQSIIHRPATQRGYTSSIADFTAQFGSEDQLSGRKRNSAQTEEMKQTLDMYASFGKRPRSGAISLQEHELTGREKRSFELDRLEEKIDEQPSFGKKFRSASISSEEDQDQMQTFEAPRIETLNSPTRLARQTQTLADLSQYITRTPPTSPGPLDRACPDSDKSVRTQSSLGLNFDRFCMIDCDDERRHTGTPDFVGDNEEISSLDVELASFDYMPAEK